MKKKYLTVSLVNVFIIFELALLFPVTLHSQDLTAEQKQERCQNNKNRIAELEPQLSAINSDLSASMTVKEMEDARTQMTFVRSVKNSKYYHSEKNWDRLHQIAARYNFDDKYCYDFEPDFLKCLNELEKIIGSKIDKAKSLDRLTLLAKKTEIDKQINVYRNNLLKWGCDSRTWRLTTVLPPGDKYAGSYWIDIDLTNREGYITGSGTWSNGAASNFTGTISGGTVTLHRVDLSGFKAEFWGSVSADGTMKGTGKNDPSSPGGNNSTYTWTAIRQ